MTNPLNVIADRLAKESGSWSSISFRMHQDFRREDAVPSGGSLFASYRSEIRYVETGLGERLYETKIVTPRPEDDSISIDYCDGKLAANFSKRPHLAGDRDQVIIKRTFATEQNGANCRPFPYASLFVGSRPIAKTIPQASSLGTITHLGRECDRLLFADVPLGTTSYSYIFDLDPDTSIPLRITSYLGEQMRQKNLPTYIWSADAVERIEGHLVATRSEYVHFDGPHEARHVSFKIQSSVDQVEFNQAFPKEMFWPKITAETKVLDTVKGTSQFPKATTQASSRPSIRADEQEWNIPLAGTVIASGIMLVAAAIVIYRRKS